MSGKPSKITYQLSSGIRCQLCPGICNKIENKSILIKFTIYGCKNLKDYFLKQHEKGIDGFLRETIIEMLNNDNVLNEMTIRTSHDHVSYRRHGLVDPKFDFTFEISLRAVLMGEDNGNDVLIYLSDFINILKEERKKRKL